MTPETAKLPKKQQWLRFILGGIANTAITYGIYRFFANFVDYQWAYLISYAVGIVFSYGFNALTVFRVQLSWKGLLVYPLVYVIQYVVSAFALRILVGKLYISMELAPLIVIVAMLPVTFIMSRLIIKLTHNYKAPIGKSVQ